MIKNMFYFAYINSIGGVETFFYNIAKKYEDHDIVIYYKTGDPYQIKRLSDYVKVVKYNGERIQCEKAFFNYTLDIIDNVDAEEYIQIIHADFKAMGVRPNINKKITRYLGVSQVACKSFKELTGIDIELAYNPYVVEEPKPILNLVSATRLTFEKGKKRMEKLADILDSYGATYTWTIFTNDRDAIKKPNIIYQPPRLDILDFIAKADYLVQLSDNEAYCYSVVEALSVGTPVIVTACPVFNEIGVKNGENGFILDFNLQKVPVADIVKGLGRVHYEPLNDTWNDILAPGESQYKKDKQTMVRVKVTNTYLDLVLNKTFERGDIVLMTMARAKTVKDHGYIEIL